MLELAPNRRLRSPRYRPGNGYRSWSRALVPAHGCAQQVRAARDQRRHPRVLARRGVDEDVAAGSGCCGALVHHMGRDEERSRSPSATSMPGRMSEPRTDRAIIMSFRLGTPVKDYWHMLAGSRAIDGRAHTP